MSLILRYVTVSSKSTSIEESFLGFLDVNNTTGQGLFDVLIDTLIGLDLDVDNVRGQGYDNGSNMKGKHQGVQKKLLDVNPRAFFTPCGCNSLNLVLCDMANSCVKAKDFFGVIQRINTIFANSTKRWQILKSNVSGLTLKSLSSTRWESRVDSLKPIRFQMMEIREALLEVSETDLDPLTKSEAKSLAKNELGEFEFIIAIIIWYKILSEVNLVSKLLQRKDMLIDVAIKQVNRLIIHFEGYRETGFQIAMDKAKEISIEIGIDPVFPVRREIRRKRHFDESRTDRETLSQEESFRIDYFLCIVDQAIGSLRKRFEQYQQYESTLGFLFTSHKLLLLDEKTLESSCKNLQLALKSNEQSDIDENDLYLELKMLRSLLPGGNMGANDILEFMNNIRCFPNAMVAYRILLTIPVTVASAERSFSKLKLLKSYLRSTMTQERLNGLAMISIEKDMLTEIDSDALINDFASQSARRTVLFS